MPEIIRLGSIEVRFLKSKHDTAGSLDMFEMICQPKARMPVPRSPSRLGRERLWPCGRHDLHDRRQAGRYRARRPRLHPEGRGARLRHPRSRGREMPVRADAGRARPRIFPRDRRTRSSRPARSGEDARGHGAPWPRPCPGLISRMIPKNGLHLQDEMMHVGRGHQQACPDGSSIHLTQPPACARACVRSAIRSSVCSMPMDRRMVESRCRCARALRRHAGMGHGRRDGWRAIRCRRG